MFKKEIFTIFCFLFLCVTAFARKTSQTYEQNDFQLSLRLGAANTSIMGEFKVQPKLNITAEVGLAYFYFYSERGVYDKYNYQYANYYDEGDQFLNFGLAYWCTYASTSLRYLFNQNTKVKYNGMSKVNTFGYLAVELRANAPQFTDAFSGYPLDKNRETYRLGLLVGRQLASSGDGVFFYDISGGMGLTTNYRMGTIAPFPIISLKVGANLFKR